MQKRVLIIGQGAREHALAWKLAQSPHVDKIFVAPGNAGMVEVAECIDISVTDVEQLKNWVQAHNIDLTVVGPEVPLLAGVVDAFSKAGLPVFGPSAAAAELEGSKVFAKNLFKKYGVPTAEFDTFSDFEAACSYACRLLAKSKAVVIKADGLAAGKGVIIARTEAEIEEALRTIMQTKVFGDAGEQVVIEEFLTGPELSFFAISDGSYVLPFMAAQDHKKIFEGETGPNTGGMGAYVNPPFFDAFLQERIMQEIIWPTFKGMEAEGRLYRGVLYAGLIITDEGPKILEYNVRFGDPETQVLMPMLKSDAYELFSAAATGNLSKYEPEYESGSCVCVVIASAGYPGDYETGKIITGLEQVAPELLVFHAGTDKNERGDYVTAGGRVLSVVARGDNLAEAVTGVYAGIKVINFEGAYYRTDIAAGVLR